MATRNPNLRSDVGGGGRRPSAQMGPYPVGSGAGDHRMDQVETQRGGDLGMGVYGTTPRPGMVCFYDGTCVTEEEYNRSQDPSAYPQPGPGPAMQTGTGGRRYEPQFRPGASTASPEVGHDFAAMVAYNNDPRGPHREVPGIGNGLYGVRPGYAPPGSTQGPASMPGAGEAFLRLLEMLRGGR